MKDDFDSPVCLEYPLDLFSTSWLAKTFCITQCDFIETVTHLPGSQKGKCFPPLQRVLLNRRKFDTNPKKRI